MSVVNAAVAHDMVAIVCDSLATVGGRSHPVSKSIVIPHAHLAVASSGAAGVGHEVRVAALAGILGDDLAQFLELAPPFLRSVWTGHDWRYPARVIAAGATGRSTVAAHELSSEAGFEPRCLPPGAHLSPPLVGYRVAAGPPAPAPYREAIAPPAPLQAAPMPVASWGDSLRAVVAAVERQHQEGVAPVGGPVVRTLVTSDYIDQRIVARLPLEPDP